VSLLTPLIIPTRKLLSCVAQFPHNFDIFLRSRSFCGGSTFSRNYGYFCQLWGGLQKSWPNL